MGGGLEQEPRCVAMASSSNPGAIGEAREERNEAAAETGIGSQLVMPEDGYEWKKYGQKFIKNIQKMRSYFRCRHKRCGAKKKVEWLPSDVAGGGDLRIVYEGKHQHGSPPSATSTGQQGGSGGGEGAANQYELGAQYFGASRSH